MILEMNFDGVITDKETIDVGNFLEGHETLRDKFSTFGVKVNPLDAVVRLQVSRFDKKVREHCNIEFSKTNGDKMANTSLNSLMIAFEETCKAT